MAAKKSGGRRYGAAASKRVGDALHRQKEGTLKSGPGGRGGRVKSRAQAIAIGLSEAREKGARVPPKPAGRAKTAKKGGARKTTARKAGTRKAGTRKAGTRKTGTRKTGTRKAGTRKTARR